MKTMLHSNLAINKREFIREMTANPLLTVREVDCTKGQYSMEVKFKMKGIKEDICLHLRFTEFIENALIFNEISIMSSGGVSIGENRKKAINETVMSWFIDSVFDKNPTDDETVELMTGHTFIDESARYGYGGRAKYGIVIQKVASSELELLLTEFSKSKGIIKFEREINYYLYEDNILYETSEGLIGNYSKCYRDEKGRYYIRLMKNVSPEKGLRLFNVEYKKGKIDWCVMDYNYCDNLVTYPQLLALLDKDSSLKTLESEEDSARSLLTIEIHSDLMLKDQEMKVFAQESLVKYKDEVYLVTEVINKGKGMYRLLNEAYSFEKREAVLLWSTKVAHANSLTPYHYEGLNQNVGKFVYVKSLARIVEIKEEHPTYYFYDELDVRYLSEDKARRENIKKSDCLFPCDIDGYDGQQILKESAMDKILELIEGTDTKEHFALGVWLKKLRQGFDLEKIEYPIYSILKQDNSPQMALLLLEKLYEVAIDSNLTRIRFNDDSFIKLCDGETLPKVFK